MSSTTSVRALAFPTLSEQDMFINAGFNVLDFLEEPMSDDQVWTLSKIASVVGISDQATLDGHAEMRIRGPSPHPTQASKPGPLEWTWDSSTQSPLA